MSFFEFFEEVEKEFFDYLEYLEVNNLSYDENGNIVEKGNHTELLNKGGRYYQLYNGMFELE